MQNLESKTDSKTGSSNRYRANMKAQGQDICDDSGMFSMEIISCDGYLPGMNFPSVQENTDTVDESDSMDTVSDNMSCLRLDSCTPQAYDSGVNNSVPCTSLKDSEDIRTEICNKMYSGDDHEVTTADPHGNTCILSSTSMTRVCHRPSIDQIVRFFQGDADGDNELHLSIINNNVKQAMFLIDHVPQYDWLSDCNHLRQTPLHLAVIMNQPLVVRRLVCAGAFVTMQDNRGDTPLHIACREGYTDIVKHLLTPVTYQETLANSYSIPFQRLPQDMNIRNGDGETCLHVAACSGHSNVVKMLLPVGADVNLGDGKSGRAALHFAAEMNDIKMVELLLSRPDIDVNKLNYDSRTAAQLAYGRGHMPIVNLIRRYMEIMDVGMQGDLSDLDISDDDESDDETSGYDSDMSPGQRQ